MNKQRAWTVVCIALFASPFLPVVRSTHAQEGEPGAALSQVRQAPRPRTVDVPLVGLTSERASAVLTVVRGWRGTSYRCESCGDGHGGGGACPHCLVQLEKRETPLVLEASLSEDLRTLNLTLDYGQVVELVRVERGLAALGVQVDRPAFRVPAFSRVTLEGGGEVSLEAVERALRKAELFAEVRVGHEARKGHLFLVPEVETARVSLEALDALLARTDAALRVASVEWRTPCAACVREDRPADACAVCDPARER